jgi:DNA-binding GntR family transcriptional regulator
METTLITTLDAIQHAPLNQRTYLQLRVFVLSGAVPMGERLDENALAKQLGVSRTPVREAIGRLVQEGLVEYRPFQGNFVRLITVEQVRELFEVRRSLEGLAARLAVENMTEETLEEITAILDEVQASLDEGDMEEYSLADSRFHRAIAGYSGNSTLFGLLEQLSAQIQLARVLANRDQSVVQRTAHERPLILAALRERDADAAEQLMKDHIQGVLDALSHQLPDEPKADD